MPPELCRLCERPAADGGHRATELDLDKLTKWCLVNLGTTLTGGVKDDDLFCCFCVWDAKFQFEIEAQNSNGIDDLEWWPPFDTGNKKILFEAYSKGLVQQSWVSLEKIKLNNPESEESNSKQDSPGKKCIYCSKNFKTLFHHIKKEHTDIAIKCNFHKRCSTYFKSFKLRDAHIKEVHLKPKVKRIMDCIYCPKKNLKLRNLYTHIKENHSDISIRCKNQHCVLYFLTKADLEVHMQEKHRNLEKHLIYKCSECAFKAPCGVHLSNHLATAHQIGVKLIQCEKCPATFVSVLGHRRHVYSRHNFKKCLHCNTEILMLSFSQHTTAVKCLKCNAEFNCRGLLKVHKLQFACCKTKEFSHKSEVVLKKMFSYVDDQSQKKLQCNMCLRTFVTRSGFDYHFLTAHIKSEHRSLQLFKCAHCDAVYKHKSNIRNHLATKHKLIDGRYHCQHCKMSFFLQKNLKMHNLKTQFNCKNEIECATCKKLINRDLLSKHVFLEHGQAQ